MVRVVSPTLSPSTSSSPYMVYKLWTCTASYPHRYLGNLLYPSVLFRPVFPHLPIFLNGRTGGLGPIVEALERQQKFGTVWEEVRMPERRDITLHPDWKRLQQRREMLEVRVANYLSQEDADLFAASLSAARLQIADIARRQALLKQQSHWTSEKGQSASRDLPVGDRKLSDIKLPAIFPQTATANQADWEKLEAERVKLAKRVADYQRRGQLKRDAQRKMEQAQKRLQAITERQETYEAYARISGYEQVTYGKPISQVIPQYPRFHKQLVTGQLSLEHYPQLARIQEETDSPFLQDIQMQSLIRSQTSPTGGTTPVPQPLVPFKGNMPPTVAEYQAANAAAQGTREDLIGALTTTLYDQHIQQGGLDEEKLSYAEVADFVRTHFGSYSHEQLAALLAQQRVRLVSGGAGTGKTALVTGMVTEMVARRGMNLRNLFLTSPTKVGAQVLQQRIATALQPLYPDIDFEQEVRARTLHSKAYSDLRQYNEQLKKRPLDVMLQKRFTEQFGEEAGKINTRNAQLLGAGDVDYANADSVEQAMRKARAGQKEYVERLVEDMELKRRGVSAQDLLNHINNVKANEAQGPYLQRLARGKALWEKGGDAQKDLDAGLYVYDMALWQRKGFGTRQAQRGVLFDLNDLIKDWAMSGELPEKEGGTPKFPGAVVADEYQEMSNWQALGIKTHATPETDIIFAGDLNQQIINTNRIDNMVRHLFGGKSEQADRFAEYLLRGNRRSPAWVVAQGNAVAESIEEGPHLPQVSATGQLGEPPEYVLGRSFMETHYGVFQKVLHDTGLSPQKIIENLAAGLAPFAGGTMPMRESPIIVNLHDEAEMLQRHFRQFLHGHGMSPENIGTVMEKGVTTAAPGSVGSAADLLHIITTQKARSQEFKRPKYSVTMGGQWTLDQMKKLWEIGVTRATEANTIFATSANFRGTGFNNTFEIGSGGEQLPANWRNIQDAMYYSMVYTHGLPPERLPQSLELNQSLRAPRTMMTPQQAAVMQEVARAMIDMQKAVPAIKQQGAINLEGTGFLSMSSSELITDDETGEKAQLKGYQTFGVDAALAAAKGERKLAPDEDYFKQIRRYAEELFAKEGNPEYYSPRPVYGLGPDQSWVKRPSWELPTSSIAAFAEEARPIFGRLPRDQYMLAANPDFEKDWEIPVAQRASSVIPEIDMPEKNWGNQEGVEGITKVIPDEETGGVKWVADTIPNNQWGDVSKARKLMRPFFKDQRAMADPALKQALKIGAERMEAILRVGGHNLTSRHLKEIARVAKKLAMSPDALDENPEVDRGRRGYFNAVAKLAESFIGADSEEVPYPEVTKDMLTYLERVDPRQAKAVWQLFTDQGKSKSLLPFTDSRTRKTIYRLLNTLRYSTLRSTNNKEQARLMGVPHGFGATTPFMAEMASMAAALENDTGGGVRDPLNTFTIPENIKKGTPEQTAQLGGTVPLHSLESRLEEMRHLRYQPEAERARLVERIAGVQQDIADQGENGPYLPSLHKLEQQLQGEVTPFTSSQHAGVVEQLATVQAIRDMAHNPRQQQAMGHALQILYRVATGEGAYLPGQGGTTKRFEQFFRPIKNASESGQRTLAQVKELYTALDEASRYIRDTGMVRRSHLNRVFSAFGHDVNEQKWTGLRTLERKGFGRATDELPLYSLENPRNLVNLLATDTHRQKRLQEEFSRSPLLYGQRYLFRGGQKGFAPVMKGQTPILKAMGAKAHRGLGVSGILRPWGDKMRDMVAGSQYARAYAHANLFTPEESAITTSEDFDPDTPLPPIYGLEIGQYFLPVRADQVSDMLGIPSSAYTFPGARPMPRRKVELSQPEEEKEVPVSELIRRHIPPKKRKQVARGEIPTERIEQRLQQQSLWSRQIGTIAVGPERRTGPQWGYSAAQLHAPLVPYDPTSAVPGPGLALHGLPRPFSAGVPLGLEPTGAGPYTLPEHFPSSRNDPTGRYTSPFDLRSISFGATLRDMPDPFRPTKEKTRWDLYKEHLEQEERDRLLSPRTLWQYAVLQEREAERASRQGHPSHQLLLPERAASLEEGRSMTQALSMGNPPESVSEEALLAAVPAAPKKAASRRGGRRKKVPAESEAPPPQQAMAAAAPPAGAPPPPPPPPAPPGSGGGNDDEKQHRFYLSLLNGITHAGRTGDERRARHYLSVIEKEFPKDALSARAVFGRHFPGKSMEGPPPPRQPVAQPGPGGEKSKEEREQHYSMLINGMLEAGKQGDKERAREYLRQIEQHFPEEKTNARAMFALDFAPKFAWSDPYPESVPPPPLQGEELNQIRRVITETEGGKQSRAVGMSSGPGPQEVDPGAREVQLPVAASEEIRKQETNPLLRFYMLDKLDPALRQFLKGGHSAEELYPFLDQHLAAQRANMTPEHYQSYLQEQHGILSQYREYTDLRGGAYKGAFQSEEEELRFNKRRADFKRMISNQDQYRETNRSLLFAKSAFQTALDPGDPVAQSYLDVMPQLAAHVAQGQQQAVHPQSLDTPETQAEFEQWMQEQGISEEDLHAYAHMPEAQPEPDMSEFSWPEPAQRLDTPEHQAAAAKALKAQTKGSPPPPLSPEESRVPPPVAPAGAPPGSGGKSGNKGKPPLPAGIDEALYDEAVQVVNSHKRASISLLQRKLKIGDKKAKALIDALTQRGVIVGNTPPSATSAAPPPAKKGQQTAPPPPLSREESRVPPPVAPAGAPPGSGGKGGKKVEPPLLEEAPPGTPPTKPARPGGKQRVVSPTQAGGGVPPPEAFVPPPTTHGKKADVAAWIEGGRKGSKQFPKPTKEQLGVYRSTAQNISVLGGAGSGKTNTLINYLGYLATKMGIAPQNMFSFSYMHSGVDELNARLQGLSAHLPSDNPEYQFPEARTFSSLASRIITKGAKGGRYPVLEKLGVKWSGRTIRSITDEDQDRYTPSQLAEIIQPAQYLRQILDPQMRAWGKQPLSDYDIDRYVKDIEQIKAEHLDNPEDAYTKSMDLGEDAYGKQLMNKHVAFYLYEQARKDRGDLDYADYPYYAAKALEEEGIEAVPEEMQNAQVILGDEAQDNLKVVLRMMGNLMRAFGEHAPKFIMGFDPMQKLVAERFGGLKQNAIESSYAEELGDFEPHVLTKNQRSPWAAVSFMNAILGHPALKGYAKSPRQDAMRPERGTFPKLIQEGNQAELYDRMLDDMLHAHGITWGKMTENIEAGRHPFADIPFQQRNAQGVWEGPGALPPGRSATILNTWQDRKLYMQRAQMRLQKRVGTQKARKAMKQIFRDRPPGPLASTAKKEEANLQFAVSLPSRFRSLSANRVFQDTTVTGAGTEQERLNRIYIGVSRPDEVGEVALYHTQIPFTNEAFERYMKDPNSLERTPGGNYQLGTYEDIPGGEPYLLSPSKKNEPDLIGDVEVPPNLGFPLSAHMDEMLQGGMSPYSSWFDRRFQPHLVQRAAALGLIPKEAMGKNVPPSLGPRFWTRQQWDITDPGGKRGTINLAEARKGIGPQMMSEVAQSHLAYTKKMAEEFQRIRGQHPNFAPGDYLKDELEYQNVRKNMALGLPEGVQRDKTILDVAGKSQYIQHLINMGKKPGGEEQVLKQLTVKTDNMKVEAGDRAQIHINTGGKPEGVFKPTGPVVEAGEGSGSGTGAGGRGGRKPFDADELVRQAMAGVGSASRGLVPRGRSDAVLVGSSGDPTRLDSGGPRGPRGSGSGGGFGFGNPYLQFGRTMARIGDELGFIGQNMQKTADSALQEGSNYRQATLQIPRGTSASDGYGHIYATMNQGTNQVSAGPGYTQPDDRTRTNAPQSATPFGTSKYLPRGPITPGQGTQGPGSPPPPGSKTSAGGDNGTQGFFDFSNSDDPNTIAWLQKHVLSMYSDTQIAQVIRGYLSAQNAPFSRSGVQAGTDISALAYISGIDPAQLTSQMSAISGYGMSGQYKDYQIQRLAGMMYSTFKGNLTEQNVAPYQSGLENLLPILSGLSPATTTTGGKFHLTTTTSPDQTPQVAALFQMALNAGYSAQNLPDVANAMANLAQMGSAPDLRQQYALSQLFPGKMTASPELVQYNQQMLGYHQQLAGLQLQQKMNIPQLTIQADNAQINLEKVQLQQAEFGLQQNTAQFNFEQWMQTQQYGAIGQDSSRKSYFDWLRRQEAAGYNPANADSATTFKPSQPFGLQNEEFYAGIEHQRSMLVLGRSPLLADAAFQEQMSYLNKQENFYVRELALQNDQRQFNKTWGERSLKMQNEALDAQKKMLPIQEKMRDYDAQMAGIQGQYLPKQIDLLQQLITNTQDFMSGKGPVGGKNVQPIDLITQLQAYFKQHGASGLEQWLQSTGLGAQDRGIIARMIEQNPNLNAQQLLSYFKNQGDTGVLALLQNLVNGGATGSAEQNAGQGNTNLQAAGVGQNYAQLIQAMRDDRDAANNVAAAMSGSTGLTMRIGDLSNALSPSATGVGTLSNIIGVLNGTFEKIITFAAGGAGGAGGGGFGTGGAGFEGPIASAPPPMPSFPFGTGTGGEPAPEGNPSQHGHVPSGPNGVQAFLAALIARIDQKRFGPTGVGSMNYGILTPPITAGFHVPMSYGELHQGVDFAASEGTPLAEFIGGKVKNAGWYPWGGEVDISIPGGLTERYLHLSRIDVSPGKELKQGDHIGLTGGGTVHSGLGKWSSGSHLHTQLDYGNINAGLDPWPIWHAFGEKDFVQFLQNRTQNQPFGSSAPGKGLFVNAPGSLASWVSDAINLTKVPMAWLNDLEIIAMHESGGNPNAINNWDINAKEGHPSEGLFQTIGPTFYAHALPGHTNIWNPVDNAAAAIGYIKGRYGTVYNVPGIVALEHGQPYVGYARGTKNAAGGWNWVGERGPEAMWVPPGSEIVPSNHLSTLESMVSSSALKHVLSSLGSVTSSSPATGGGHTGSTAGSISVQTLVGTLNLTVNTQAATMTDAEKDTLMADVFSVLQGAIRQIEGKP